MTLLTLMNNRKTLSTCAPNTRSRGRMFGNVLSSVRYLIYRLVKRKKAAAVIKKPIIYWVQFWAMLRLPRL